MTIADEIEVLHHTDQRAVRSVDSLTDAQWAEPSLLPHWTRAHVIAHLALNAEGFARALEGLLEDERVPIYPSNESRNADIEALASRHVSHIRDRYFATTQHFRTVANSLEEEHWADTVLRLPEGPEWPARSLIAARRQEVEVHHADLGMAYTAQQWPSDFTFWLIDRTTGTHADSPDSPDFALRATDVGRTWQVGASQPEVAGTAADLAWWLIGRGHGEGLSPAGNLPTLGPWQRQPVQGR
jgi:maleylpyruvate isomerase